MIDALRYSSEDERRRRPNPSKIPFEGNARTNLASYRSAVENYRRFLSELQGDPPVQELLGNVNADQVTNKIEATDDVSERIGLERDMQAALRSRMQQLEPGLAIIDDGAERYVSSGRIDITARDVAGAVVVIELKAGAAGQRAVAQILSYMGDVAAEEPDSRVRGLLVAASFDKKAIAAARMVPTLSLKLYSVQFMFEEAESS